LRKLIEKLDDTAIMPYVGADGELVWQSAEASFKLAALSAAAQLPSYSLLYLREGLWQLERWRRHFGVCTLWRHSCSMIAA
jgi:uncharacterized membrane protein YhhN